MGLLVRRFRGVGFLLLAGTLLVNTPAAASNYDIGTGPAVAASFVAAPFDAQGQPDAVLVAWRDDQASVHSGLLRLDDGSFAEFPSQAAPGGYVANLATGAGGPPDDRRAYVAWGGSQLSLMVLVFDAEGSLVNPPRSVAHAVQVTPLKIAGTDSGALLSYAWDSNLYWDPRILALGLDGAVVEETVAENAISPEQTLGVSVAATPDGAHALVYVVSDTHAARIRRYAPEGIGDPEAVEFFGDAASDYVPYTALFTPAAEEAFLVLAVPSYTGQTADLRFSYTTLEPGEVTLGPALSELVPEFDGGAKAVAGLAGSPELVVVLWEKVDLDPNCVCSAPPPIRIEFLAQLLLAGNPPQAVGTPFTVHLWEQGDPIGPPLSDPILTASTRTPGQFTVLFSSDGLLRYATVGTLGPIDVSVQQSASGTVLSWNDLPAADSYNVIRGRLEHLVDTGSTVDLGPVVCIEGGSVDTSTDGWEDAVLPDPGKGFFYLVEAVYSDGSSGSYGTSSAGEPRLPGPGVCG